MQQAYADAAAYGTETNRLVAAATDLIFRCASRRAARALAKLGNEVWLYSFEFRDAAWIDPAKPVCALTAGLGCGIPHAAEVKYVLDHYDGPDPRGHAVAKFMSSRWAALAKRGSPNGPEAGRSEVLWPQFTRDGDEHLIITEHPTVGKQ